MTNTEPLDLDAIEARAAKATIGPWKVWAMDVLSDRAGTNDVSDAAFVASTADPDRGLRTFNADFIAAARQDVPALIAEVRRLREARTTCAWCDLDSLGVALHNDGATYPSCGQHGQDFRQETR